MNEGNTRKLLEDLKIHQVELETQAEELRRAQQEAQESRDRYLDLYDYAPVGYLTMEKGGGALEANLTAAGLLGVERNELIHSQFTKFVATDSQDAFYFHMKQAFETGTRQKCEIRMHRKDGSVFYTQLESIVVHSEGKPDNIRTTLSDITERKKAEDALKASENLMHAFFDSPGVMRGIVEIVDDTTVRHITDNHVTASFMGLTSEALRNKLSSELGEPTEIIRIWVSHYKQSLQTGKPVNFEYQDQRGDHKAWLSITVSYLRTIVSGQPQFAYVAFDITGRKQAEESLRETGDYLNNLLDYANAPVIVWDPQYHITHFNHAFERLTGRPSDQVIGKELDILFPDNRKVESMAYIARASSGERWDVVEIPILHKDGSVRTVLWNSATLHDKDGKTPIATIAQGQDITERRRVEEAMQLEQNKLIGILNSMEDGVCIMNQMFVPEYINPSMQLEFGNVDGRRCYQYFNGRDDVCPWCNNKEVIVDGQTIRRESQSSRTGKTYEITDAPLKNVDGSTSKLAVFHDITERKKVEQLKDEFIGMVSHELKTPLTVMMGALGTATAKGVSEEDAKELIQEAAVSTNTLAGIVENLLELSRSQANRLELHPVQADIEQIARDVVQKLQSKSQIHQLNIDFPEGLSRVTADPIRVERILFNLVENAIKYSPKGGEVRISAYREEDALVVSVSDQGPGISREDQKKLFQSFEQLAMRNRSPMQGVGLGLKVCRTLVEAHGGQIYHVYRIRGCTIMSQYFSDRSA